jgi:integrase
VNRELACLKAAFRIGYGKRRLSRLPLFPHLREADARSGFVEDGDYAKLTASANQLWMRTFLEIAYTFGWRKGELLGLRVHQCNLLTRTIRLEGDQSKNGRAREVVMTAAVYELIKQAVVGKNPDDFLLTREGGGKPVRDFRRAWRTLAIKAGLGKMVCRGCGSVVTTPACDCGSKLRPRYVGRICHDFRRSAARQLRRAGVPESVVMAIGGWKTAEVFRRYAIVSDADQRHAVEMLEERRRETAQQANAVHGDAGEPARIN